MNQMKTVHVLTPENAGTVQGLYFDPATGRLVPNLLFVNADGEALFETNSLGLRGAEPEPNQRIAVIWGCSVVFSIAGKGPGWPELVNDPSIDCLFLNGGIEGSSYLQILTRALSFNRSAPVALNVLMLGWKPFLDNRNLREDLSNAIVEIPNAVLVTQPTSLNPTIAGTDLRPFFNTQRETRFDAWHGIEYSVESQQALYNCLLERNAIIREVADKSGTPLIDLFRAVDSSMLDDFRQYFYDYSHLRETRYAFFASLVREAVRPLLTSPAPV